LLLSLIAIFGYHVLINIVLILMIYYQDYENPGKNAVSTADGTPVPDAALNLVITLDGFERNIAVTTDTDGAFSHTFTPLPTEAGIYTVAALYPDTLERPTQSTFTVSKIDIQPSKIRAYNGDILCFYAFRHKSGTLRDVIDILVSPVNAYPGGGLEDF